MLLYLSAAPGSVSRVARCGRMAAQSFACEESFEHIALHLQLGDFAARSLQLGRVLSRQAIGPLAAGSILGAPVAQRALIDTKICECGGGAPGWGCCQARCR